MFVSRIQFIGYFRGGGYEAMSCYLCPIYASEYGILGLPGHISQGDYFQKMDNGWGVIQYHMADLLHGYGAQLIFGGIWRGPEYGPEIVTMERVAFYRFRHFRLWEHVPENLACAPEELPPRFVAAVLADFRGIIGSGGGRIDEKNSIGT